MKLREVDPKLVWLKVTEIWREHHELISHSGPYDNAWVTSYNVKNADHGTFNIICSRGDVTPKAIGDEVQCLVFRAKYSMRCVPVEVAVGGRKSK